jgi:hypothetical protein
MKMKATLISVMIFLSNFVFSQTGLLRTQTGVLAYFKRDSISFTLQLDGSGWGKVEFKDASHLSILNRLDFFLFKGTDILAGSHSPKAYLAAFKKWEQDYIDSPGQKRTYFEFPLSKKHNEVQNINVWYYYGSMKNPNDTTLRTVFLDFYKKGYLFRFSLFSLNPSENPFEILEHFMSFLKFYKGNLSIEKLQEVIRKGEYYYEE